MTIKWNDDYSRLRDSFPLIVMLVICIACMAGIVAWFLTEAY